MAQQNPRSHKPVATWLIVKRKSIGNDLKESNMESLDIHLPLDNLKRKDYKWGGSVEKRILHYKNIRLQN